jgi:hypothetical protein
MRPTVPHKRRVVLVGKRLGLRDRQLVGGSQQRSTRIAQARKRNRGQRPVNKATSASGHRRRGSRARPRSSGYIPGSSESRWTATSFCLPDEHLDARAGSASCNGRADMDHARR